MGSAVPSVLLIGYGNPGRLDDGLGPALIDALEGRELPFVTLDSNYQLQVEDADAIARHDVVLFVDADVSGPEPFWFGRVEPRAQMSFSSHSISPEALLDMSNNLLNGTAQGYVLGIRGYDFNEFGERLSPGARRNMDQALAFVETALREQEWDRYVSQFDRNNQPPIQRDGN